MGKISKWGGEARSVVARTEIGELDTGCGFRRSVSMIDEDFEVLDQGES